MVVFQGLRLARLSRLVRFPDHLDDVAGVLAGRDGPTDREALDQVTDRKSLLALRGVGPESEAESVRFHRRRVTRVGPEVKHGLFRVAGRAFTYAAHRVPDISPQNLVEI